MITIEERYNQLLADYKKLQEDYSENTVIQSMKDMKEQYERMVTTSVSRHVYKDLNDRHSELKNTCKGLCVIIDHIKSILNKRDDLIYNKQFLDKAEVELIILKDIIEYAIEKN